MRRLVCLLCLPLALAAQERWNAFRSGPFEVVTTGGDKPARDVLVVLEQFRHTFGTLLSRPEMGSLWPIRVVVERGAKTTGFVLARDAWIASIAPGTRVPQQWLRECGRILLDSSAGRMPRETEEGLLEMFSTLDVQVTRVTLGAPPPERTPAWHRLHLVATNPEYSGKLRVLLANLQQGMDEDPAWRNAFGKTRAEIDRETDTPATIALSGRAIDPEFHFPPRPVEAPLARVIAADLLPVDAARRAYDALPDSAEAHEGLGFLHLREGNAAGARRHFAKAIELGSRNARAHLETGAFESASKLNPRWAEPYLRRAATEKDPRRQAPLLAIAAKLDPRNAAAWSALAQAQFGAGLFSESARSWIAAERAAATEEERAALHQTRLGMDQRRLDAEAAERKRLAGEKERELEKLKNEALERIRAAEARAAGGNPPLEPGRKVEEWWGDNTGPGARVNGVLERMDCLGGPARLAIRASDGKTVQLLIRDPSQVVIEGGGEQTLRCGPQKPPRKLTADYTPRADKKMQTSGDATFLRFQ
ncbi:MAG: hypothetical protein HY822_10385 [Acidobacteria bacterium]|nr:hypothetical protein [Acidobacteriota bacterium]